jgi:hypothetical protein
MITSKTMGAIAANVAALCFITGFALYFTLLAQPGYPLMDQDPAPQILFMIEHSSILYTWYLIIYLIFGFCLIVLVPILHQQQKKVFPLLSQQAAILGLIWAGLVIASGMLASVGMGHIMEVHARDTEQAKTSWLVVQITVDALGGGNEIVGGLWILMTNLISIQQSILARWLSITGIVAGLAGILTLIPELEAMAVLFGLGCIAWFGGFSVALMNYPEAV